MSSAIFGLRCPYPDCAVELDVHDYSRHLETEHYDYEEDD